MTRTSAFLAALLTGCGAASPPAAETEPKPAVVAVEAPPDDAPPQAVSPVESTPRRVSDLTGCATEIRDAASLPASGEERELYGAALEAERAGDLDTARKTYFELIQKMPRSRLVPLTYLAFGELFRTDAESERSRAQQPAPVPKRSQSMHDSGWRRRT